MCILHPMYTSELQSLKGPRQGNYKILNVGSRAGEKKLKTEEDADKIIHAQKEEKENDVNQKHNKLMLLMLQQISDGMQFIQS